MRNQKFVLTSVKEIVYYFSIFFISKELIKLTFIRIQVVVLRGDGTSCCVKSVWLFKHLYYIDADTTPLIPP